ncbi:MAG TPA: hypothetical protein VHC22_26550 [Pirellulales bacterium]|nr:hypothetical protein [Pirellulales bacterium]
MKSLKPSWIRQSGSNVVRLVPCGGRKDVVNSMPSELQRCIGAGGHTTLMVWADCDDNCPDGDALKALFWREAERQGITREQFDDVVFVFPKDRLENWIEFLRTGITDEANEGPRVKNRDAANAARKLAEMCEAGGSVTGMPPSLLWSCKNWRVLVQKFR